METIFGYTWEEIAKAQQGHSLGRTIAQRTPGFDNPCLPSDVDLLIRHGLKELENRKYYGVIDRLARAGIIEA